MRGERLDGGRMGSGRYLCQGGNPANISLRLEIYSELEREKSNSKVWWDLNFIADDCQ